MLQRIIRIAVPVAAALALLLEGGCVRTDVLEPTEGTPIAFEAGNKLLRDDATTKSTTDGFTVDGESFVVFGEKVTASETHSTVFNGVTVSHTYQQNVDEWGYTNPRFWWWTSQSDRYDFVAVYPAGLSTVKEQSAGNITVSTHYDYASNKEDLLAAVYRRTGADWASRYNSVPLTFRHMGSAVAVTVKNTSSTTNITVTSIYYQNLVVRADAKVSLDVYGDASLRWANPGFSEEDEIVRKLSKDENPTTITPQTEYTGEYQIMIPQDLDMYEGYEGQLYLTYKVGDNPNLVTSDPIPLAEIKRADGSAITSWRMGNKYTYTVSVRLDGGLLVTVATTPWDEPVQGETPGILI